MTTDTSKAPVLVIGKERRDEIPPLRFAVVGTGDVPQSEPVEIYHPDGGVVADLLAMGGDVRGMLQLLLGSDWPKVAKQYEAADAAAMYDTLAEVGEHFKLGDYLNPQANRAERRRQGRGRG